MKKFLLSLVSLFLLTSYAVAGTVKIAYAGSTTTNMTGNNDAALFGVSGEEWNIVGVKGGANHFPGLNKDGSLRLYYNATASSSVTFTVIKEDCTINKIISMSFNTGKDKVTVSVGGELVEADDEGSYAINSTSFVLGNGGTDQVQIKEIILDVDGMEGNYVIVHIANTAETAYTVAEAFELIDAGAALSETVFVKGIVSQVDQLESNNSITYWISDDGTTENQFECYKGFGIDGVTFESAEDIEVGASVIVKGTLKKYNNIYELNSGNQLVSYEAPEPEPEPVANLVENADFSAATIIDNHICTYAKDMEANGTTFSQMQEVAGWAIVNNGDARAAGVMAYGADTWIGGAGYAVPAYNPAGLVEGQGLGIVAVWSGDAQYTQAIFYKPGYYLVSARIYNAGGTTTTAANLFGATVGETSYYAENKSYEVGAWTRENVTFQVEADTEGAISLGYKATNAGNASQQHLFYDAVIVKVFESEDARAAFIENQAIADAADAAAFAVIKAKAAALATLETLSVGESLFQYSQDAIDAAKIAIEAAETVEDIAAAMPAQNLPETDKLYSFQLKDGGNYMTLDGGTKLAAKAMGFSFVPDNGGGYAITNGTEYVACTGTGDNIWSMGTATEPYSWVITYLADGYYTLAKASNNANYIGVDDTAAGSSCFADKGVSDKASWAIAEYVAPTVYTVAISESIENGTVAAEPASAEAGEKIQLTATPAEGYELEGYIVTCETINEVVVVAEDGSFTMPADDVTVSATFVEAGPAPVVWEAYPGWVRDNVASAYYFGVITPGTASEAFAMSGFQLAQESGAGAAERYAVIATAAPEGTTLSADKVLAVSENPVTPTVANPGKNYDYTFSEDIILKGATTYYVVFTTANEPVDGNYTVGAQRLSLNVSYGEYAPGLVAGNGTAQKNWTPGFKAQLTVPAFAITCAVAENGSIQTDVAEAKAGEKVIVTATPAEGYKLKNIMVTGKTTDIAVEVAEDGSFIMPADEVTVSATFQDLASVVYIETDLTSQFSSLTDYSKWVGATGYTATNYCPAVTTNAGQTVQVCEKYVSSCTDTGDIFYQTLSGLAEGTYKIELYGGAAFTFGRGFGSQAFTGETGTGDAWGTHVSDTYTAGQHIDTETGVKLYAVTSEGEFGGEIPIYYATDFPDGAAVVTLNGVKVGSNGEMKIGMSKTSQSTNWHVIQLKGVTATVDAASLLAHSVKEAKAIDPATVPAALATQINETVEANDKEYETAEEYQAAIAAIDAVVAKAAPYAPLTEVLNLGETYKANSSNEDAKSTYDTAIADVKAAYDAVTVEDFAAAIATVKAALPALAKSQTADNSDMSILLEGLAWTVNAGNGPNPYADCTETFAETNIPAGKVMYQSLTGLNPGKYEVKMLACANVAWRDCNTGEGIAQVYVNDVTEDIEVIAQTACTPADHEYTLIAIVGEDGTLEFGLQNIAEGGNWYVAKPTSVKLVKALYGTELAYEKALASIKDGESYRIFTEVGDKKFYLNTAGYLVADVKNAATFTFTAVKANGTVYETGWNLGCKFTNPETGGNTTFTNDGHIHTNGKNDRNDWERQVFFLNGEGKYAVRATNANNAAWGSNTYWNVFDTEATLPTAGYTLDTPAYVWQIEANVDNRPAAYAIAQNWPAKLQVIEGLVTDASQWTTNAQESSEGPIKDICDGNIGTHFHSQWSGTGPDADHYIQATLPEAAQKFHIAFYKRNDNNRPTSIVVSAGDAEPAQTITEGLPAPAWYSAEVDLGADSDVIRFTVTNTNTNDADATKGKNNGHVFFTFGEFYILPCNEMTDAAAKYIVSNYTDIDPDFNLEEVETLDAQIEAAYQQALLKEDLADLVAYIEHAKEYVAAYPAADADELVRDATTTLNNLANGEYTTKEEIASAKSMAITAVKLFVSAAGTPTKDTDITEWFIVNPTPTTNGDGWTITNASGAPAAANAYDPGNNVAEFWNQAAHTIAQTVTLPAGDYKLTAIALQRTDMTGYLFAGETQTTLADVVDTEVNSRTQANTWFNDGNGVNEVEFTMAETGEIGIGITTDKDNGDHWTVWRSFKIEKLAPAAPESVDYAGILEQTVVNRQTGKQMGETTTDDQTITLIDAGEGLVDIKVNGGFTLPIGMTIPEFTIKGVAVVESQETASATYSYEGSVTIQNGMMTSTYDVTLTGYQASVEATPVFCVVLTQALIDTIYFGADQNAIDAYKQAVGIKGIKAASENAAIYDLSGRKVEKMVKGGIYIVNGKKVSFK